MKKFGKIECKFVYFLNKGTRPAYEFEYGMKVNINLFI